MTAPRPRSRPLVVMVVVLGVVLVGVFAAARIRGAAAQSPVSAQRASLKISSATGPVSLGGFANGFSSVIGPALPAVVNISSTKVVKVQGGPLPLDDPFLRQFFGDQFGPSQPGPRTQQEHALGSGVIVNPDGYILTNNHVVSAATDIHVFTLDQQQYIGKVLGTDPRTDIALLKIDAHGLPTLAVGDSARLKVGDLVFAIGDPLGVGETATMGIVSATNRALGGQIEDYEDFVQTDAAINPGNSGGALIDAHGDLIGINTAIVTNTAGGNQGIGLAVPIGMARNVMQQILDHGKVVRGYLGVTIQRVDPDMAKAFGLSRGGGALVADVQAGSPAAKAGLQRGDVVLELNGETLTGSDMLSVRIAQLAPGTVAHLRVFRDGQTRDVSVTLAEYPETAGSQEATAGSPASSTAMAGVQVQALTPQLAQQFDLPASGAGVVIVQVAASSHAAAAGLRPGDLIQEVGHKPVRTLDQYQQALSGMGSQAVLLLVNRAGATHFVIVQP